VTFTPGMGAPVSSETIPDKVEFCENPKLKSINAISSPVSLVNSLFSWFKLII
jgi:hypothetical protein